VSEGDDAKSDAILACPEVREIAGAWPTLPEAARKVILGIVRTLN